MSHDIISSISHYLTPDTIARISSSLDLERASTEKAISASIPGILAGLAGLATKPEGARRLANAVDNQPDGVLETLTNVVGRTRQGSFIESGMNALTSLLGDGAVGTLTSAVGRFAGIARGSAKTLLGLLAPVVLAYLGREKRDAGLDTYGLARMLDSQKDRIAAAMPGGFSNLLQSSGFLNSIHTASAAPAARMATASVRPTVRAVRSEPSQSHWAYWVLPLLALGGLAWYFLAGYPAVQQASDTHRTPAPTAVQAGMGAAGAELGRQLAAAVDAIGTSLQGVKDTTSATAALPKLQQLTDELEQIGKLSKSLPAESRDTLAKTLKAFLPKFNSTIDSLAAIPGVMPIVKPTVDQLRTKFDTLAMAADQDQDRVRTAAAEVVQAGAGSAAGGVEVGRQVAAVIDSITASLQGVKDPTSATAALPKLQQLIDELERLSSASKTLPAEYRNTLAKSLNAFLPEFRSAIDGLAAHREVMPILKPTVDVLRTKIDKLTMAEASDR